MHTNIDYSGYSADVKKAEALKDCREWLSDDQFETLSEYALVATQRQFAFACSFAGIQGYPVTVLWTYLSNKEWNDDQA